jgi:hypothetical protein
MAWALKSRGRYHATLALPPVRAALAARRTLVSRPR